MSQADDPRLSQLSTHWALLARAHSAGNEAHAALAELLPRYCPAVYRYLLALVRDATVAEELCPGVRVSVHSG